MDSAQIMRVNDFFKMYSVTQVNPQTVVLTSEKSSLLVKIFNTPQIDEQGIAESAKILDEHLSFDAHHVCPLLHFEIDTTHNKEIYIRAIYQYPKLTLKDQIYERGQRGEPFSEEQLWILISSLTNSLLYLQQKGVVYGVLSNNKIVIEDKIRLIDPSAFTLNPLSLSQLSLISPELKNDKSNIDLFQSDVYLLGLCMLEAATLIDVGRQTDEDQIQEMVGKLEECYSDQLVHVIRYMLKEEEEERPTYTNIRQFIEQSINMRQTSNIIANLLSMDDEDEPNDTSKLFFEEYQNIDILEIDCEDVVKLSQYDRAKVQYLEGIYKSGKQNETFCDSKSLLNIGKIDIFELNDTVKHNRSNSHWSGANFERKLIRQPSQILNQNTNTSKSREYKKTNAARQLKNRLIQKGKTIKTIQSIHFSETQIFTDPLLMKTIQLQTQRYREYRNKENSYHT